MTLKRRILLLIARLKGRFRRPLVWSAAALTDKGLVRENNEDAYLLRPGMFFVCVADGMGGGACGEMASRWICDAFASLYNRAPRMGLRLRVDKAGDELQTVNQRIRAYAKEHGYKTMGSTLAFLMADPSDPTRGIIAHVGDSRIYRWRNGQGESLTIDHTVGSELGRALSSARTAQAAELKSRQNPLAHILTRAVGTELRARPDWRKIDICLGDRYLLCTDGVHDVLSDAEITAFMGGAVSPEQLLRQISAAVKKAGAPDNFTVVCAFVVRKSNSR